jgi:hypothetical protein
MAMAMAVAVEQQVDSQISKRLFLLSRYLMKKTMRIFENLSTLIDIQVGNEELDLATTESCDSSSPREFYDDSEGIITLSPLINPLFELVLQLILHWSFAALNAVRT